MRDILLIAVIGASLLAAFRFPYMALLAWAWFTLANPHVSVEWVGQYSLNVIIAGAALLLLAVHGEFFKVKQSVMAALMILFTLWLTISQQFSLEPAYSALFYDRFLKTMALVVLAVLVVRTRLRLNALMWVFVLVMAFFGVNGAIFTISTLGQDLYFGPENTVLYDNNHLGIAMAVSLPLFVYVARQAGHRAIRLAMWGVLGLTIIAIIGTHSRGAFISLLVFGLLMIWQSRHKLALTSGAVVMGLAVIALAPEAWVDRMESIGAATDDASFMGRVHAWVTNIRLALENPITGAGLRVPYLEEWAQTVQQTGGLAAHSVYLEVLGGTGFIGLVLYLGLFVTAFWICTKTIHQYKTQSEASWRLPFARYARMALIVFAVGGASVSMEMWTGYLLLLAMIGALPHLQEAEAQEPAKQLFGQHMSPVTEALKKRIRQKSLAGGA